MGIRAKTDRERIAELTERVNRLEKFITAGDAIWCDGQAMLDEGSLRETISDTVQADLFMEARVGFRSNRPED